MLLPTFLLSPLFGITADRINPRNGLLWTLGLQSSLATIAAVTAMYQALQLGALMTLALALGAVTAAHTPIRLALIPRLVARGALPSAIGYSAIIFNTSRIIGPALGAWLLLVASVPAAFAVAALSSAASALMLLRVRGTGRAAVAPTRRSFFGQLVDGLRYLRKERVLGLVFLLTLTSGLLGRTALELLPAVSGKLLAGDSTTLATLTASAGVGSILGGLLVSRQSGRLQRLFQLVFIGLATASLILLTASLWQAVWVVAVCIGLIALCTTVIGTGCQALTQLMVAEDFRGRVLSLWTVVAMGTPALGALLIGSVADVVGFPIAFAGPACAALAAVFVIRARFSGEF